MLQPLNIGNWSANIKGVHILIHTTKICDTSDFWIKLSGNIWSYILVFVVDMVHDGDRNCLSVAMGQVCYMIAGEWKVKTEVSWCKAFASTDLFIP